MFSRPHAEPLTPDKIYAGNLAQLGLGYPLWCPDPHVSGTPLRGDVGAVLHGRFIRLLHVDTSESAASKKVTSFNPPFPAKDIQPLPINALLFDRIDGSLRPGRYCSHGISRSEMYATATAPLGGTGPVSLNLKVDHKCHEKQGAALTLQSSAHAEVTLSMKFLKAYAARNFLKWHRYATTALGFEVEPEDIILVTGWHKTGKDWAATALGHDKHASSSIDLGAGLGGLAAAGVGGSLEETMETSSVQRHGPGYSPEGKHSQRKDDERDQCVFVKGVRVKRRTFLPNKIMASAGPHRLPRSGNGRGAPEGEAEKGGDEDFLGYDWQEYMPEGRISDPVSIVLEYIFEVSNALVAVASDDQVECILCGRHVLDFATLLRRTQFRVEVDADVVGSLCMEDLVSYQQEQKFMRPATGLAGLSDLPQTSREHRPAHPPITTADLDDWPQITRKSAGTLTDSQIFLGPTQSKACPVNYKAVVFGDAENMKITRLRCVSLSPDGTLLAAATGNTIAVWRVQDGLAVQRLDQGQHTAKIWSVAFSPDGQYVVSAVDDKLPLVCQWNVKTGNVVHRLEGHEEAVRYAAFSPDGAQIATRSRDSLRIWDASNGSLLHAITDLDAAFGIQTLFSPDGSRIAARSAVSEEDTAVVVLDSRTAARTATLRRKDIWRMAFAPQGDRIAAGCTDGSACVWDAASGTALLELREHTDVVREVAFSPDGGELATASSDGTVVTCDARTGKRRFTFRVESVQGRDKEEVNTVAYSPKNDFIACGADDGCVRVWNRRTGGFVAVFQGHSDSVWRVLFTPDGWDVLSYGFDHVVRLWSGRDALRLS
ncbi:WD40 repeat domain-containing protein [Phanerochaete sordida]|uniref:WD40 repeat domain-containing protein n=1 Tax=Phanerochaete sordida TaxID=48140 RepID=A0A9P3GDR1_9APHY|nr:WD40 repeat domain-containing protein [Phanerochaete sordida]